MRCQDMGPPDASIMIVGDCPGEAEEKRGEPFAGASGKLLKQMLSHSGIDYNSCYVTYILDTRPPSNDFSYMYEGKMPTRQLEDAWARLRAKVEAIKPKVVIVLGKEPLKALCNKNSISAYRGTWLSYRGINVMPTYSPSYVLKVYNEHVVCEMDLAKAATHQPAVIPTITLKPSLQNIIDWVSIAIENRATVSFDIETVLPAVRCIAFASDVPVKNAIVIPFMSFKSNTMASIGETVVKMQSSSNNANSYWSVEDEVLVIDQIDRLFNSGINMIGQNSICFDEPVLFRNYGLSIKNHYLDTMHAWHCLYSELPKGLDFLVSVLTDYSNYWSEKCTENDISEWTYNAMDAIATLDCANAIVAELLEVDVAGSTLYSLYIQHVMPLAKALVAAQQKGVLIDIRVRQELINKFNEKNKQTKSRIDELAGSTINCNSPKQVKELLYDKMKFPVIYNDENKATTDENAILKLRKKYPNEEILQLITMYRKDTKLVSTFLDIAMDEDNRMRTSYNVSGTKNYRISSSQDLEKRGMNLQNIPTGKKPGVENIRYIFVSSHGYTFVKCDLKQAETMVVARILCRYNDYTLWDKYANNPNFDIHKWTASTIFKIPEDKVEKQQRDIGKVANHAGNYCSGPRVIQNLALGWGIEGIDYDIASKICASRKASMPGLVKWWKAVEDNIRNTRTMTTCLGRRRLFFGRCDDNTVIRDAVAFEPQSTVGDVCNTMFRRMYERREEYNGHPLLQVHDEVVVECKDDMVDRCVRIMKESGIVPLNLNPGKLTPLIIPLEISVGKDWYNMKEVL